MGLRYLVPFVVVLVAGCYFPEFPREKIKPEEISIIPQPEIVQFDTGYFKFENEGITYSKEFKEEAEFLKWELFGRCGFDPQSQEWRPEFTNYMVIRYDSTLDVSLGEEYYELAICPDSLVIRSRTRVGVFRGIQTLLQIVPAGYVQLDLPSMTIKDRPHFSHRGLLLDCCRHFWSVDVVKKYIDLLAYYKMNVLHWHLTEDQGWRVEIKKYPKLTEVGAWRTEEDGSRYGGFYTQDQIKEVVEYAAVRHITVIPEIELPGHSLAALASYPLLACTDGPFEVTPEWGVFKDVYCAGDDSTFLFLEDVLTEVMELFPSEYIHIGGDESPKFRWEHCDKCQKRIKDEGLHDEHELQSYFIRRIQKFLNENDRKLIGWDEILEGGLAPGATVQSWRGMQGGIDAATSGSYAIMSPTSHCYLDYGLELIDLENIYMFDPIPEELDSAASTRIKGGECNMWTEHVPDEDNLDSKVFPRMIGLAEVLWTYDEERDFQEFSRRLEAHYPRLEAWGVNYGFEKIPIGFETEIVEGGIKVSVQKAEDELSATTDFGDGNPIEWTTDSTFTENQNLVFTATLDGREYPKEFPLNLAVHHGLGIEPKINAEFSSYYTAGGIGGLTDGIQATLDFRDGRWQGYQPEKPLEVEVDLGEKKSVSSCSANFYQYNNAWIFAPTSVEYAVSEDGETYKSIGSATPESDPKTKGQFIEKISVEKSEPIQARFVRMTISSLGPCPDWHDAAGSPSWIFVDEFVIN